MAARPDERYVSARALIDDLDAFAEQRPGTAWRDGLTTRLKKAIVRRPALATIVAASILSGALLWGLVESMRLASFRAQLNERTRWVAEAQAVINRPRAGLSYNDAYHEAARRIQGLLLRRGLDVRSPERFVAELDALAVTDTECADLLRILVHELGLALVRAGVGWRGGVESQTVEMRQRLERVYREAAEADPDLVDLWADYVRLRGLLVDDEWSQRLWLAMRTFLKEGDRPAAEKLWVALAKQSLERPWTDVVALARESAMMQMTRLIAPMREIADSYPMLAPVHLQLRRNVVGTDVWRQSTGRIDPARTLRVYLEAEALARATAVASPENDEHAIDLAASRGGLARAYVEFARQLESLVQSLAPSAESEAVDTLRSVARGMRIAGISWRVRQVTFLRGARTLKGISGSRLLLHIAAVSAAHRDLEREVPVAGRQMLLGAFERAGLDSESLLVEFEELVRIGRARYGDSDDMLAILARGYADLDRLDEAEAVLDSARSMRDGSVPLRRAEIHVLSQRLDSSTTERIRELEELLVAYEAFDDRSTEGVMVVRAARERIQRAVEARGGD